MHNENESMEQNTWDRHINYVYKVGFLDGITDGQESVYQPCFDSGYKQGFEFGFELGLKKAMLSLHTDDPQSSLASRIRQFQDPRRINCQICLNVYSEPLNVGNLYNIQQEKNNEIFNPQT